MFFTMKTKLTDKQAFHFFLIVSPQVELSGPLKVSLNDPATFKCLVESNPVSSIKWFKDNVEIEPSPTLVLVENATFTRQEETYRIQEATPSHLAVYKCEAENTVLGEKRKTEKSIDFKVECKLLFFVAVLFFNKDTEIFCLARIHCKSGASSRGNSSSINV